MFTMPRTEPSSAASPGTTSPRVGSRATAGGGDCARVSSDRSGPESRERARVLKEVGLTSASFIGPTFPAGKATAKPPDIEDTLSEFYRELEGIDAPGDANSGKHGGGLAPHPTPVREQSRGASQERNVNAGESAEPDGFRNSSGQRRPPWPHWHQNEPYYPRRPRPGVDLARGRPAPSQNHCYYPRPLNRPANPAPHRPPFPHLPPSTAFPNPQNPPPHANPNWSRSGAVDQYQEEARFSAFLNTPSPDVCSPPTQGYYKEYPRHFDRDEWGCSHDVYSDNENTGWSGDREEEWPQFDDDYDRRQRFVPENEAWEQQRHFRRPDNTHAHHSSLVLILMRGLPGSGKSTLARELLSTGPSGLILSTDDYFAQENDYRYDPGLLGVAHHWNQGRAKDAMHDRRSPIIIDNTNTQAWEMKPYVTMALERGYRVDFCEPDTGWKFDPYELEKRNKHGVPHEKIAQMLDRFAFPISVDIVMSSQEPPHVNQRHQPEQLQVTGRSRDLY
ncbi:NEDD4-binding protein 2-like 2 isoform X2 [Scophthalmus maximus]|uniref:NEDD4-binding protein 2-like 2 isoform X2 n=1 Tax=Scophthalmus maximus TaxID=52904 RepID=UPI001FA87D13|nr:NEDD4-binding protein 2-like 2 isoform X2 [Scophthalmus maximus]